MRFIALLDRAVGTPQARGAALFFSAFAVLLLALAGLFSSFLVAALAGDAWPGWGNVLFLVAIVLAMWAGAIFFVVVTLALGFGRAVVLPGAWPLRARPGFVVVQTRVVRLWGVDLVREYRGAWQPLAPQPMPATALAWSWVAFAQLDGPRARGPAMVVDAAVWQLVTCGAARLRLRTEARQLVGRLCGAPVPALHAHAGDAAAPAHGAWEAALHVALHGHDAAHPLPLHDWIGAAFGAATGDPMRSARERVAADLARQRPPIENDALRDAWPMVHACIAAYMLPGVDVQALVFEGVRAALRDCTDTG